MSFGPNIITNKGRDLIAKLLTGQNLEFTKMVSSSYDYTTNNIQELTSLLNVQQTVPISSIKATTNSVVEITGIFKNNTLNTGYNLKTIGLFAKDPQEGEILFSVTTSSKDNFMPESSSSGLTSKTFTLATQVNNSNNAIFTITDAAGVPISEFTQYKASTQTKLDNIEKNLGNKIGLYIGETLPEVNQRDNKTMYWKVTETISTSATGNIKVSPNMGLKEV